MYCIKVIFSQKNYRKTYMIIFSERKCSDPGTPSEGSQLPSNYRLGDTVSFNCSKPGFTPKPVSMLTCIVIGEDLVWDGEVPVCKGANKFLLTISLAITTAFIVFIVFKYGMQSTF